MNPVLKIPNIPSARRPSARVPEAGGIYCHVPFCLKKCRYCDFFSSTRTDLIPDFIGALLSEIRLTDSSLTFDTLYFGGGTPSLLPVEGIDTIISTILKRFNLTGEPEITLEVNPGAFSPHQMAGYRGAGINRINLGVQSFRNDHLAFLGRVHDAAQARQTLQNIRRDGFDRLGIDLIYGLPGQTHGDWIQDLKEALAFSPEHLSCYLLTYEPGTPLTRDLETGTFRPLSEKASADLFTLTREFLEDNGYFAYEISNFAKIDPPRTRPEANQIFRSRHNQKYWRFAPYLGFGPAAHTYLPPVRSWNVRNLDRYLELAGQGRSPVEDSEVLTPTQDMMEAVALGLRTAEGIPLAVFSERFGVSFRDLFQVPLTTLLSQGLVRLSNTHCSLTPQGLLLQNSVAGFLVQNL